MSAVKSQLANGYDYEICPQGLSVGNDGLNHNYTFLFDHVTTFLCSREKIRILEIGAGGGRNLQVLHRRFGDRAELFGTDISSVAIHYAKSLQIGRFSLAKSDAIPFDEKFDLILMVDVLEHLETTEAVVDTLNNALDRLDLDGRIYISVPLELGVFSLTWFFSKFPYLRDLTKNLYGHLIQFDADAFCGLIGPSTFQIEDQFYSVHFFTQLQVLLFFYAPKILLLFFLGKTASESVRDSNETIQGGRTGLLSRLKKGFVVLSSPLAYLGYQESRVRRRSDFAAGNMHLLLARKTGPLRG
jgi:SAM-dependent methyltransferase